MCTNQGWQFLRLDGSTDAGLRQTLVDQLNSGFGEVFVFLLSAKAGGTGLNLIGANRLVLHHCWLLRCGITTAIITTCFLVLLMPNWWFRFCADLYCLILIGIQLLMHRYKIMVGMLPTLIYRISLINLAFNYTTLRLSFLCILGDPRWSRNVGFSMLWMQLVA